MVLACALATTPAHGLGILTLNFNDGHDHINLSGTVGVSRDTNVFATRDSKGDWVYNTGLTAEYTRRAGWIGVNASAGVASSHFATIKGQDFSNPTFSVELTKQSGRTTGSFTLSATRESRADAAVNLRTTSWTYSAGLNYAYPIIERFKLAGQFGYSAHKYTDNTSLANLSTYTAGVNLFYVYNTERDLTAGYRYRYTETSEKDSTTDHDFTVGMNGRIIRGLNGSVSIGYQFRVPHGAGNQPVFSGLSATGSTTYSLNRKTNLTGLISKDFSTTATDSSVDTTAADLDAQYAYTSHWSVTTGVGYGDSHFLGQGGRVVISVGPPPVFGAQRHDTFVHADAGLAWSHNEHLKISVTYSWFKNWSTTEFADFDRSSWNIHLDSRL